MFANSRDQKLGMGAKWGPGFPKDRVHGSRFEEKNAHSGRTDNEGLQPSRKLWVGNLSQHVSETILAEQFSRFGEIENISVYSARNFAFITFRKEEDALIAKRSLQGLVLGGLALKIEFAKGESHGSSSHYADETSRFREDRRSSEMSGASFVRDTKVPGSLPEGVPERHKGDRDAEPSEVLWIGFPSFMKVDEMSLRREFAPFGEIERVTTFPGRTYAFVQFRSVASACRAKDALQGKLFNNPRVKICFPRSEYGPPEHTRNPANGGVPFTHRVPMNSPFRAKIPDNSKSERGHGISQDQLGMQSPGFVPHSERLLPSSHANRMDQSNVLGSDMSGTKDSGDFSDSSPVMDRSPFWTGSIPEKPRGAAPRNEVWDSSADEMLHRDAKRPRFGGNPSREPLELPRFEQGRDLERFGVPRSGPDNFRISEFNAGVPDSSRQLSRPPQQIEGLWNGPSNFESAVASSIPCNLDNSKWDPSDSGQGPLDEDWKWQGTIAKGGTPICRARCFPVGKVLDVTLPEFLNCTARTGLDMLAKHFYQAGGVGVVFFVPENDLDIIPYNEFMHYLGEKQRAAVAKLGEGTTLFLVPPSHFSEQVLKVPGKVSISGVILKFQQPNTGFGFMQPSSELSQMTTGQVHPITHRSSSAIASHEDSNSKSPISQHRFSGQGNNSLSTDAHQLDNVPFSAWPTLPPASTGSNTYQGHGTSLSHSVAPFGSSMSINSTNENRTYSSLPQSQGAMSSWPSINSERPSVINVKVGGIPSDSPGQVLMPQNNNASTLEDSAFHQQQSYAQSKISEPQVGAFAKHSGQSIQNEHNVQPQRSMTSAPTSAPQSQTEQLAQLASLLGRAQSMQLPVSQTVHINQQPSVPVTQVSQTLVTTSNASIQPHSVANSNQLLSSQFTFQKQINHQSTLQSSNSRNQEVQTIDPHSSNNAREESEADTQKRLQATLQLAATLLQQIQQQSRGGDQQ